jgi:hypothetical protein
MKGVGKRFLWVSVYAIAMAVLEAVVVVYIRGLLRITTDHVSLGQYVRMEALREAATIVMLVAVGWLAGRGRLARLAYGLFAFGLWDIFYWSINWRCFSSRSPMQFSTCFRTQKSQGLESLPLF